MLLTAMLKREMQKELDSIWMQDTSYTTRRYEHYKILATRLNTDVHAVEHFITSKDNEGMIHVDFVNTLFERYRDKIINPIKSKDIATEINKEEAIEEWNESIEE